MAAGADPLLHPVANGYRDMLAELQKAQADAAAVSPRKTARSIRESLNIVSVVGALGAHHRDSQQKYPKHLRRRISSARELYEAAEQAEAGSPMPGTLARVKLDQAQASGDFAAATHITDWVKGMAPAIRKEADKAAQAEAAQSSIFHISKRVQESKLSRADAKRAARKAKRARKPEAQ